jgi:hypothetical protein
LENPVNIVGALPPPNERVPGWHMEFFGEMEQALTQIGWEMIE